MAAQKGKASENILWIHLLAPDRLGEHTFLLLHKPSVRVSRPRVRKVDCARCQQLSWDLRKGYLRLMPGSPMFDHCVENDQELTHARRECHLLRFPCSTQALIEGPDHRIEPGRDNGAHIEDGAHLCPSAPDGAAPSQRAAVTIQGRHADEGHDLLVRQHGEFWATRQQGRGHDGTYTRHTLQQFAG